ncbi:EEF1AKMT3 [Symbiodinium sp. CCMP2592]|nr:EEF1AKMT3 [Symbiodinium sp. CCMP2592]
MCNGLGHGHRSLVWIVLMAFHCAAAEQDSLNASEPLLAILPPAGTLEEIPAPGQDKGQGLLLSIRVKTRDGVCEQMLDRGCELPAEARRVFTTTQDDQAAARIELYVGERPFCEGNRFLGMLELAPLPMPSYRSFLQLEVIIRVDARAKISCAASEIESRALGEPYCRGEWQGDLSDFNPPPPSNPYTEVVLFSHALAKHLPVLLPTRTIRLPFGHSGRDIVIRQHQRREQERIGTGGVLWEAAIVLADFVARNSQQFAWQGKRVLELGAGTGLVAIALALEGADICATDGNPRVLDGAEANIQAAMPFPGRVVVEQFDWNSAEDLAKIQAAGPWGAIVGSDLVYPGNAGRKCVESNVQMPPADQTLISLLSALANADTTVLLALKDRTGELQRFHDSVSRLGGWTVHQAPSDWIMPEFRMVQQVAVLQLYKS